MRAPAFATTALLACLALVGCEKDAVGPVDPDDTATPSQPSTTPTPTGPTPPVLPEAAKANTARGAIAFVEHYIELLNYAANTGDVDELRKAAFGCAGCDNYVKLYESTYQQGGSIKNPGWEPIAPFAEEQGGQFTVVTEVTAGAVTAVPSAGASPQVGKATTYSLRFRSRWTGEEWQVTDFKGEES